VGIICYPVPFRPSDLLPGLTRNSTGIIVSTFGSSPCTAIFLCLKPNRGGSLFIAEFETVRWPTIYGGGSEWLTRSAPGVIITSCESKTRGQGTESQPTASGGAPGTGANLRMQYEYALQARQEYLKQHEDERKKDSEIWDEVETMICPNSHRITRMVLKVGPKVTNASGH
jgi:hypothetical protein